MWGKGVCDIWEKWVVWVETSNHLLTESVLSLAEGYHG